MKFKILRSDLLNGLVKVRPAVSSKELFENLRSVYLGVDDEDGVLTLRATNNDLSISSELLLEEEGSSGGEVCVPGHQLITLLSALSGEFIELHTTKSHLHIKSNSSKVKIKTSDVALFPEFPQYQELIDVGLDFIDGLKKVAVSMSKDEQQIRMRGVLFESTEKVMQFIATNNATFNLFVSPNTKLSDREVFIPDVLVSELLRVQKSGVKLFVTDNVVGVELETETDFTVIAHRKFGEGFVKYQTIINPLNKLVPLCTLAFPVGEFKAICERALLVNPGGMLEKINPSRFMDITLLPDNSATVHTHSDVLDLDEKFMFSGELGVQVEIQLKPVHLLEFLSTFDTDVSEFYVDIISSSKPLKLHVSDEHFIWLVPNTIQISSES